MRTSLGTLKAKNGAKRQRNSKIYGVNINESRPPIEPSQVKNITFEDLQKEIKQIADYKMSIDGYHYGDKYYFCYYNLKRDWSSGIAVDSKKVYTDCVAYVGFEDRRENPKRSRNRRNSIKPIAGNKRNGLLEERAFALEHEFFVTPEDDESRAVIVGEYAELRSVSTDEAIAALLASEKVIGKGLEEFNESLNELPNGKRARLKNAKRQPRSLVRRVTKALGLSNPKRRRRRRNSDSHTSELFGDTKLDNLSAKFLGQISGESLEVESSSYCNEQIQRAGHLKLLVIETPNGKININFDGESYLAFDIRKNMWLVGSDAKLQGFVNDAEENAVQLPNFGTLELLGIARQIDYETNKAHIGGNERIRYWHELGEVDSQCPMAFVDHDGFILLVGGNYDVWNVGIVN